MLVRRGGVNLPLLIDRPFVYVHPCNTVRAFLGPNFHLAPLKLARLRIVGTTSLLFIETVQSL